MSRVSRVLRPSGNRNHHALRSHNSQLTSHSVDAQTAGEMGVNGRNALGFDLAGGNGAANLARTLQRMRRNVMDAVLVAGRAAREA